ncbi:aminoglycoside phosphotransferase/kinase family protein [Paenibacillus aurantius]|uniref:hypothetical protein n=1 Tax=Paenibacillus aurantius TaxID=2918900 RepID=UPI00387FACF8
MKCGDGTDPSLFSIPCENLHNSLSWVKLGEMVRRFFMDLQIKKLFGDKIAAEGGKRFGIPLKEMSFLGGFQNFVYSYRRNGSQYILRFTPGTLRTSDGIKAELEWIRYLASKGIAVSEPVSSWWENEMETISGSPVSFHVTSFHFAAGRKMGIPNASITLPFINNSAA